MGSIAIKAVDLSKSYVIRSSHERGRTLQEDLIKLIKTPFTSSKTNGRKETVWALRDVNFEVEHGEVVGIIGRNGAGKSTLLKILSQITDPTSGYVDMYGRVGSLLEVGTGFHTELTGRENIYLGGAVLGMTRQEIRSKFDEIVAFSGVERFLNVPVKRYSSGMQVRLAFSVAAHLEPEILLIDEVLAVGDSEFQKKCLSKMDEVAKGGRTVLFVSHDMGAVSNLCSRTILLSQGKILLDSNTESSISKYLSLAEGSGGRFVQDEDPQKSVCLLEACVQTLENQFTNTVSRNDDLIINLKYKVNEDVIGVHIYVVLSTIKGDKVLVSSDASTVDRIYNGKRTPGIYETKFKIPNNILNALTYKVSVNIVYPGRSPIQKNPDILFFSVYDTGTARVYPYTRLGAIHLDFPWDVKSVEVEASNGI